MPDDAALMRRALGLAERAVGRVSPRPPVGAVVVSPNGGIVGEGYTQPIPGPHAEVVALAEAGGAARGATLYVTLEPCSHQGHTGPCVEAILEAGVARVVAALRDPNPLVGGRGLRALRRAGIEVRTGVGARRARQLIEPFATWVTRGRPFVTLKAAATLDGKVAAPDRTSRWITGEEARADAHALRAQVDAVMVGAGTVAADDPSLTCRLPGYDGPQPRRVLVDSSGRTPPTARLFDGRAPTVVLTTAKAPPRRRAAWAAAGAEVVLLPEGEGGVAAAAALEALGRMGICHLLCEGGPTLAHTLIAEGLVDRLVVYLAPKLVGGDAPGLLGGGVKTISEAWGLRIEGVRAVGRDLRVEARPG